jgi:maleylacetoacetate isomerase
MADMCVAAQVTGAGFFKVNVDAYPTVMRIATACAELPAFAKAHPLRQPGAPASVGH